LNHFCEGGSISPKWGVSITEISKKTDKIPKAEIEKAKAIMKRYFEQKYKK